MDGERRDIDPGQETAVKQFAAHPLPLFPRIAVQKFGTRRRGGPNCRLGLVLVELSLAGIAAQQLQVGRCRTWAGNLRAS